MENTNRPSHQRSWTRLRKVFAWGFCACLCGLMLMLLALHIEAVLCPISNDGGCHISHPTRLGIQLLEHLGVALIVLGLVGIMVDFRDWREYFQERLAEIVVKRSYLGTLDRNELISLQTDTLKAFFKVEDIDRKGSFLDYFHSRIRDFIGSPYREDVRNIMVLTPTSEDDGYLVKDHLSYSCRKVGESIQPTVRWSMDPTDVKQINDVRFILTIPAHQYSSTEFASRFPGIQSRSTVFEREKLTCTKESASESYHYDLVNFRAIDELRVSIDCEYILRKHAFMSWSFILPSKELTVTIDYPAQMELAVQTFGMEDEDLDEKKQDGLYSLHHSSWVLPNSGLVCQLRAKNVANQSSVGVKEEAQTSTAISAGVQNT